MSAHASPKPLVSPAVYKAELVHVPAEVDRSLHAVTRLTPIELALRPFFCIRLLFFFDAAGWLEADPSRRPQDFMETERMKVALARVLGSYPVMAARFQAAPSPVEQVTLVGCDGGAQFESGTSAETLSEMPLSPETYTSLTNPPSTPVEATVEVLLPNCDFDNPLNGPPLMIRHTRFACGSVCLGVHLQHFLGDAEAYFGFMRDFGECYRQEVPAPLTNPPSMDRSWLQCTPEEMAASPVDPPKDSGFVMLRSSSEELGFPGTTSQTRLLRFTVDELKRMKEAATPEKGWVSTFEALSAHIARCVYEARNPDLSAAPSTMLFVTPTNLRARLGVVPPPKVFCNAVLPTVVRHDAASLQPSASLSLGAGNVHAALRASTPASWRATMAWMANHPNKDLISGEVDMAMESSIILSAWNKFGSYLTEFEAGSRPSRICPSFGTSIEGLMFLNDNEVSPGGEGSLDAFVALDTTCMARLLASPQLRQYA